MNYLKEFVQDIKVAQAFLDALVDWYRENTIDKMPRLIHNLEVCKYPKSEDFGPLARVARHDGVWISTNLNVRFIDNGGHKRYGNVRLEHTEHDDKPNMYDVFIGNFNLTLEVHTPFSMTSDLYKTMFETAKRELNEFYQIEFEVPAKLINDEVLQYKLTSS